MVRAAVAEPVPPTYSGLCAFRGLVPAGQAPAFALRPAQTLWLGPAHHLVHYPDAATRALRRYAELRISRATRLQEVSHARALVNHLPDGPGQEARDASFAQADPLIANGWIYSYDPESIAVS
jgi:salicylate hydroxylase